MEEFEIDYGDLLFTVLGDYEPEQEGSYFEPYERDRFNIRGVYLGDACVDFMLNSATTEELEQKIIERYYR